MPTLFGATNAALTYYGRVGAPFGGGNGYRQILASDTECVFKATGTACVLSVQAEATNTFKVSVDGGAFTDITLSDINTPVTFNAFTGLSDAAHLVVVKRRNTGICYFVNTGFISLTGASPAIAAVGVSDGYGPVALLRNGDAYADEGSWLSLDGGAPGYASPPAGWNDNAKSFNDARFRVKASASATTTVKVWAFGGGGVLSLEVDGVSITKLVTPTDSVWQWRAFDTTVDLSSAKVVSVTTIGPSLTTQYVDAVMILGTGAAFGASLSALQGLGGYGDSIVMASPEATTNNIDSRQGTINKLAAQFGMMPYNRGIGGTKIETGTNNGAGRTADITGISPELFSCLIAYGINDLIDGGNGSSPSGTFGTATQSMLTALLAGTTATKFVVLGIRPASGYSDATLAAWNGSGNGISGSVAAVIAATPAYASRLSYVDPAPMQLNGVSGTDYTTNYIDGLHLNDAGYTIEANFLASSLAPIDTTPPTVTSFTTAGMTLVMTPSEAITGVSIANFSITGGHTLTGVSGAGAGPYTFTLNPPVAAGEVIAGSFTGTNTVFDTAPAPNAMATFSGKPITNTSTLTVPAAPPLIGDNVEPGSIGINVGVQPTVDSGGLTVTTYYLERSLSGSSFEVWAMITASSLGAPILDDTTAIGDAVIYRVRCRNILGYSSYSPEVPVTSQGPLEAGAVFASNGGHSSSRRRLAKIRVAKFLRKRSR